MCVYMYVCMYVYVCLSLYVYVCVYTRIFSVSEWVSVSENKIYFLFDWRILLDCGTRDVSNSIARPMKLRC